jgi:hypothetical protein
MENPVVDESTGDRVLAACQVQVVLAQTSVDAFPVDHFADIPGALALMVVEAPYVDSTVGFAFSKRLPKGKRSHHSNSKGVKLLSVTKLPGTTELYQSQVILS